MKESEKVGSGFIWTGYVSTFFIQLGIWAFPAKNKSDPGTQGGSDKCLPQQM